MMVLPASPFGPPVARWSWRRTAAESLAKDSQGLEATQGAFVSFKSKARNALAPPAVSSGSSGSNPVRAWEA